MQQKLSVSAERIFQLNSKTYSLLCNELILPTFKHLSTVHGGIIFPKSCLNEIKEHYEDIMSHAKFFYMANHDDDLNRHKVCAALMIAILKTKPIKKVDMSYYEETDSDEPEIWPFNECLAVTVTLSVLRMFILARVDYAFSGKLVSKSIFEDVCYEDKNIFENGIPLSDKERKEWEWELYQVRQDGAYNVLSIAHILCSIEKCARLEYFQKNRNLSPTYPDPKNLTDDSVSMLTIDQILS